MSVLLDILGSTIIGGLLLIMALNILDTTTSYYFGQNDDLIVQENLTTLTQILEYNLRKMGFAVPEGRAVIIFADSSQLMYLGDNDGDWQPDTVQFYLGGRYELNNTRNPNDRFIYRKVNSQPANGAIIGVVTMFDFTYLDQDGQVVDESYPANYSAIKMIRITLQVESSDVYTADPNPASTEYRRAFWQQTRLVSRNLRR
ncbi:hypothetical protein ISS30_11110 [bacterium]|nr:hypothetical protein [FCB group bacterium]MBL7192227.1 hypothetical protein [bacterium]